MIGQYLSQTDESVTVAKSKKKITSTQGLRGVHVNGTQKKTNIFGQNLGTGYTKNG